MLWRQRQVLLLLIHILFLACIGLNSDPDHDPKSQINTDPSRSGSGCESMFGWDRIVCWILTILLLRNLSILPVRIRIQEIHINVDPDQEHYFDASILKPIYYGTGTVPT